MDSRPPDRAHAARPRRVRAVQFYDSDTFLCDRVTGFLAEGVGANAALIVIATPSHVDGIKARCASRGLDVAELCRIGRSTFVDAAQTLSAITIGDSVDEARFRTAIGGPIEHAQHEYPGAPVHVYGELVDLLWQEGKADDARRLEGLWSGLSAAYSVSLLGGYALRHFAESARSIPFDDLCRVLREALATIEACESDRTRLLASEQAARIEAEFAGRLKDEFLATLSHELRTPLNAILGWAQIASRADCDGATVRRGLDVIRRNAEIQVHVINDLLDVSRVVTGRMIVTMRPLDLIDVIEESVRTVRPALTAKAIDLRVRIDPAARHVVGDRDRLLQALWNLLSNAVRFTGERGHIELRLEAGPMHARIVVQDSGQGISADFLPHVFDRFRQADAGSARVHGGLGLGLSVARHLIEAHGGSVSAASAGEGRGATFTVSLPLAGRGDGSTGA